MAAKLRITLRKSSIGHGPTTVATLKSLGLRRLNQSVVKDDSPTLRGQVMKVKHLVSIEEEANATK